MGAGDRHGGAAALAALVDQVDAQTRQRSHAPGTHPEFDRLVASESDPLFGLYLTAAAVREGRPSPVVWKPILKPLAKN